MSTLDLVICYESSQNNVDMLAGTLYWIGIQNCTSSQDAMRPYCTKVVVFSQHCLDSSRIKNSPIVQATVPD